MDSTGNTADRAGAGQFVPRTLPATGAWHLSRRPILVRKG
jgi:hypothetical protein